MPSPSTSSSRRRSSAVKKIQQRFRSKQTIKQKSKASQLIQTRVRGNKSRKLISRVKSNMETDSNCPICLQPMTNTEKVATLLPCGHRFHTQCIRDGLRSTGGLCPLCKITVTNIQPRRISLQEVQESQQQLLAQLLANQQEITQEAITMDERLRTPPLSERMAINNQIRAESNAESAENHYRLVNTSRSSGTISEQQWQTHFGNRAQDLLVDARYNMVIAREILLNLRSAR